MISTLQSYPLIFVVVGGLLSVFSPCCISTLPIVIGVLGKDKRSNWRVSIYYSIGFMISVGVVGIVVSKLGVLLQGYIFGDWYVYLLSFLLMVVGLHLLGLVDIWSRLSISWKFNKKSAFLFGLWCGVFSTPCATAIWVMILTIISSSDIGWFYGFVYGFVHGVTYIIIAYLVVRFKVKVGINRGYQYLEKLLGVIIIVWGIHLIM